MLCFFCAVVLDKLRSLSESSTRNDSYIHKVCACHPSSPIEQISSIFLRTRLRRRQFIFSKHSVEGWQSQGRGGGVAGDCSQYL